MLTTPNAEDRHTPADNAYQQVKQHMEKEGYWPNAWFISDHGNAHLIDLEDE